MRTILEDLDRWSAESEEIAMATVVGVRGSTPKPAGARLGLTRSGRMTGTNAARPCEVATAGAAELALVMDGLEDGKSYDHGDWGDAKLVRAAATARSAESGGSAP